MPARKGHKQVVLKLESLFRAELRAVRDHERARTGIRLSTTAVVIRLVRQEHDTPSDRVPEIPSPDPPDRQQINMILPIPITKLLSELCARLATQSGYPATVASVVRRLIHTAYTRLPKTRKP
jgi:hypothetical protein